MKLLNTAKKITTAAALAAALLAGTAPMVCTGGNGSGGVRPGAGGGADLLAVPVGMVSAGTVPAVGVPASRLALAALHPGRFWTFAGGVRFST